jgi:hypothetical protein
MKALQTRDQVKHFFLYKKSNGFPVPVLLKWILSPYQMPTILEMSVQ